MWSEHRFIAFDRTPLFFRRLRSTGRSKGAVLIVHGMGEHGGRYEEFAEHLASSGFSSYLPDLRGFGLSGGKRGCLHHFSDYFRDLEAVRHLLLSWEGEQSPFILGHSYGGLIVSEYLASSFAPSFRGMVLSSPNFGISIPVPRWRQALAYLAAGVVPDMTQSNRVDRTTLTHDRPHMTQRAEDKLIHDRISARMYTELAARIGGAQDTARQLKLPALILQAGEERVVSRPAVERYFAGLASTDKQYQVYEGLYHEILNETSRQTVYQTITDWLAERAK